jgi:mono/diheme cytochrome c family protein
MDAIWAMLRPEIHGGDMRGLMRAGAVMLFASATLAGCGDPDPEKGAAVYDQTCATCHGDDGTQGTLTGDEPAADLTVEIPEQSDDALESVILDGFGEMPAQPVNPGDVDDLIAYLHQEFGGGAAE